MADSAYSPPMPSTSIVTQPAEQKRLLRERMALAVERLLAAMDDLDGDPDFELSGDEHEPSLGWTTSGARGGLQDLEDDDDREPEESDLGNVAPHVANQSSIIAWAFGEPVNPSHCKI